MQAAGGPHAEQLIEVRHSLGMLQQQAGDHRQALASLQGALQAVRINDGLYSMSQVAILEAIIDSNVALGARDELRRNYEYLFWLYQRNYGDGDAGLLPVIKRVGQWYFDLYNFSPPNTTVEPLIAADDLYAKALRILPEDGPPGDRVDILYKVAVINHHVAEDVLDPMLSHREIREAMLPHGRITPYVNEAAVREYYAQQSFYKGKRSLQRIVKTYEATLPAGIIDYARALVFMGDWLTVQRRVLEGARKYRQAWAALAEHGAGRGRGGGTVRRAAAHRATPRSGRCGNPGRRGQLLRGCAAGRPRDRLARQHPHTGDPPRRMKPPWSGAPGAASPPPATAPATGTANRSPPRTSPCASSSSTRTNPAGCISDPGIWNRNLGHP